MTYIFYKKFNENFFLGLVNFNEILLHTENINCKYI